MRNNNEPAKIVLTPNQDILRQIDGRLGGLRVNNAGSGEIARMEAARADVVSRMDAAEVKGYDDRLNVKKSASQIEKEARELEAQMALNVDRPSI